MSGLGGGCVVGVTSDDEEPDYVRAVGLNPSDLDRVRGYDAFEVRGAVFFRRVTSGASGASGASVPPGPQDRMVARARRHGHRFFVAFQSSYMVDDSKIRKRPRDGAPRQTLRTTYMFTSFPSARDFWVWIAPIPVGSLERRFFEQIRGASRLYFDVDFYAPPSSDGCPPPDLAELSRRVLAAVKTECAHVFRACFGKDVLDHHWRITDGSKKSKASFHMTLCGCGFFPDNTHAMRQFAWEVVQRYEANHSDLR